MYAQTSHIETKLCHFVIPKNAAGLQQKKTNFFGFIVIYPTDGQLDTIWPIFQFCREGPLIFPLVRPYAWLYVHRLIT